MRESSWAAAGMLAAHDPENPSALLGLAEHSRSLYDGFLRRVEALTGTTIPYRTSETLQEVDAADARGLGRTASGGGTLLSAAEAERANPGLRGGRTPFLLLPEHSLDPRDLCTALPRAAVASGVELRSLTTVLSVDAVRDGVRVTMAANAGHTETLHANCFLNCAGAWAAQLDRPMNASQSPPTIRPRKGQMLTMRLAQAGSLQKVIRAKDIYLVPRGDGRVVMGATVEEAGFDKQAVPAAMEMLRARATRLWPAIAEATAVDSWAGLRPGTADDLPLIGMSDAASGGPAARCFIAAGHFRNGILLAPGTADAIARLIAGEAPHVDLRAFAPDRFAAMPACDKRLTTAL